MNDEEAVSPVIAVILMVAITVVLAATVFVLVNELGQDVGSTGPNLGLTSAQGTGADQWNIRVTSATQSNALTEYTYTLATDEATYSNSTWGSGTSDGARFWISDSNDHCYDLVLATSSSDLEVGERFQLKYKGDETTEAGCLAAASAGFDDSFPTESHELEFIHRPTSSSAGTIQRDF